MKKYFVLITFFVFQTGHGMFDTQQVLNYQETHDLLSFYGHLRLGRALSIDRVVQIFTICFCRSRSIKDYVKFLSEGHVSLYDFDERKKTMLHYACIFDRLDLVEWLLPHIENMSFDDRGRYPIHYVRNIQILNLFIKKDKTCLWLRTRDQPAESLIELVKKDINRLSQRCTEERGALNCFLKQVEALTMQVSD